MFISWAAMTEHISSQNQIESTAVPCEPEPVAGFFATSYVGQHKTQGQPELVEEVWSVFTLEPPDMDHWNSELDCFQITVIIVRC